MQDSGIPSKFTIPWGNAAGPTYIRSIPTPSQIGIENGAASLTDGFPPLTFQPIAAGGTPPWGADFNGILNQITAWSRWFQAGGPIAYDSTFQSAVGGYPNGAVVQSATSPGVFWMSTVDNNTTNPDTGGAGWLQVMRSVPSLQVFASPGTFSFTVPANITRLIVEAWGGGGGGAGNAANQTGNSGGSGAYGLKLITGLTPLSSITVTVGSGGSGGAAGGNSGSNGGTSSFGSYLTVLGGSGGPPNSAAGAGGGPAPSADISIPGGPAHVGTFIGTSPFGNGGYAPRGGGGGAPTIGGGNIGNAPGGGGGYGANVATAQPGGAGGAGRVIVYW